MLPEDGSFLKEYKTTTSVPFDLKGNEATDMRFYFGPNQFSLLKSYDDDVEKAEPTGSGKDRSAGMGVFSVG